MDIEFHYYITYILARKAGLKKNDSYRIAYSSQYVDDNTFHYHVNFADGGHYLNAVSQTMDITKPSAQRQKIYPLFHFIPGDPNSPTARRKDAKTHILNTTANSANAKFLFKKALDSTNLYRIGVATHGYADSWAHQNFVGMEHDFNAIPPWVIIPNIGHADGRHEPDKVNSRWKDLRLIEENQLIDNNVRFLEAAEYIFYGYCRFCKPDRTGESIGTKWSALKDRLQDAMDERSFLGAGDRARIKAYKGICGDMPEYDKNRWRYAAVEKREMEVDLFERYWAKENFHESDWYNFQEAVIQHRDAALKRLRPLFKKEGLQTYNPF